MATTAGQSSAQHHALLRSVLSWPAHASIQPYQTRSHRDRSLFRICRFRNDVNAERCVFRDGGISHIGALSTNHRLTATDGSPPFSRNRLVLSSVRAKFIRKACLQSDQCRDRCPRYWPLDRSISVGPAKTIQGSTVGQANTSRSGRIHPSARTGGKHFSPTDLRGLSDLEIMAAAKVLY